MERNLHFKLIEDEPFGKYREFVEMKPLLIVLMASALNVAWSDEGVDIIDPDQVEGLDGIQEQIDAISTAVMQCMDAGKSHQDCLCESAALMLDFNTSVKNFFLNHPGLEKLDIVRFKASDGSWVSQSLSGIRKQASAELSCP
jgi:hypothetical protein